VQKNIVLFGDRKNKEQKLSCDKKKHKYIDKKKFYLADFSYKDEHISFKLKN
jgi:hypothetical protein